MSTIRAAVERLMEMERAVPVDRRWDYDFALMMTKSAPWLLPLTLALLEEHDCVTNPETDMGDKRAAMMAVTVLKVAAEAALKGETNVR